jgi:Ca-activated chloride channel family protein
MLTLVRPGARTLRGSCLVAAVVLLVLAICGPQWGRDISESAAASGRDLVVVLDLSRSMLAEKPSRHTRAVRALNDLCDGLENRGGHRVALVVFAARAGVVFPLTHDVGHLRAMLTQLDIDALPPEFRPDAASGLTSGTRIGEGIAAAVAAHDARCAGAQDVLLVSDGDDPAADDEWKHGIQAAVNRKIPVHTLSVGDPRRAYTIPYQGESLRYAGEVVQTTVQEKPLQTIAAETGGIFIAGRTDAVPLGKFYREAIEPLGRRQLAPETQAVARPRYAWFLGPALGLFAVSMLIGERRRAKRVAPVLAACIALMLVGGDSLPTEARLIRQANDAFVAGEYERALALYTQAAASTDDPGLVALNKGAALYRLQRFAEAEQHFRRCLDDQESPLLRRARCFYDLGNSLMQQEHKRQRVEEAIRCYRACLQSAGGHAHRRRRQGLVNAGKNARRP